MIVPDRWWTEPLGPDDMGPDDGPDDEPPEEGPGDVEVTVGLEDDPGG